MTIKKVSYIRGEFKTWLEANYEGQTDTGDSSFADEFLATFADRNDTGNSHRLQIRFGDDIKAVGDEWIAWNGKVWERGATHAVVESMQSVVRSIKDEAMYLREEKHEGEKTSPLQKHLSYAVTSGNEGKISAAIRLAASEMQTEADEFDSHRTLLNTPSGIVDLRTGNLTPHDKEKMLTGMTRVDYDPDADTTAIREIMSQILMKKDGTRDELKEKFVQVALGYSMRSDNPEKAVFVFCGDEEDDERNGNNAKSTVMNFVRDVLGKDGVSVGDKEMLVRNGGRAPDIKTRLPLVGPRICYIAELSKDDVIDSGTLKLITGEEAIEIKSLYRNKFEATVTAVPVITTNTMSSMSESTGGVWNRIFKIELNVFFYDDNASQRAIQAGPSVRIDKKKIEGLRKDPEFLAGVMRWLVEGAVEYHKNGLPIMKEAKTGLDTMKDKSDPFTGFFNSCITRLVGAKVPATEVYNAYLLYCHENAIEPESQRRFGEALNGRGFTKFEKGGKVSRMNVAYTPAGFAYANGNDPESAMDFTVENEGTGVAYTGTSLPDAEISAHFKITGKCGMMVGDTYGPYRVTTFGGYRQMDPDLVEKVRSGMSRRVRK